MAVAFAQNKLITCIHKHYTVAQWEEFALRNASSLPFVAVSAGSSDADSEKLAEILSKVDVPFICLDVANGYSEHVRIRLLLLCYVVNMICSLWLMYEESEQLIRM